MADSLQHIIDSSVAHKLDSILLTKADLIEKVDSFYNSAWDKLTIYGVILAVFIPSIIAWFQRRELNIRENALKKQIQEDISTAFRQKEEELKTQFEDRFKTSEQTIIKDVNKGMAASKANSFHLQAINELKENDTQGAILSLVYGCPYYLKCEDYLNLRGCLGMIDKNLSKLSMQELREIEIRAHGTITKMMDDIDDNDKNSALLDLTRNIRITLAKIIDNPPQEPTLPVHNG